MWADFVQDPDVKNVHNNIHVDDQIGSLENESPQRSLLFNTRYFFRRSYIFLLV